jgi:hypothetical protein
MPKPQQDDEQSRQLMELRKHRDRLDLFAVLFFVCLFGWGLYMWGPNLDGVPLPLSFLAAFAALIAGAFMYLIVLVLLIGLPALLYIWLTK